MVTEQKFFTKREAGFTLLEMIVAMIIVGLLALVGGMVIVQGVKGYLFSKSNASMTQKAQLALNRLTREIIELESIDLTTPPTSTFISINNPTLGNHNIGLDGTDLKIGDGVAYASGDVLVDQVSSFTLTYFKGASTWVPGTDDIDLLSEIGINFVLNRSDGSGGQMTFATRVIPRNNKNLGGAAPTSSPPTKPNYGCFVTTAASEPGCSHMGRLYVYFKHVWLFMQDRVQIMLCALLGLWMVLLIAFIPAHRCLPPPKCTPGKPPCRPSDSKGSVMITLLATMVIFSALGAAMLPLFSSSSLSQVTADQGRKAYYLAESGFRYAASQYLNAGNESAKCTVLENLNDETFTLADSAGSFALKVYPYWYEVTSVSGATLATKLCGDFPPGLDLSAGGHVNIDGNCEDASSSLYEYGSAAGSGSTATFTRSTGNWVDVLPNDIVLPVAMSSSASQTVIEGGSLSLQSGTGESAFPLVNGLFKLEPNPSGTQAHTVYSYEEMNGTTLEGITLVDTSATWTNLTLTGSTRVILEKYLQLSSTGTFGTASREILYNVPVGWVAGGGSFKKEEYKDRFNDPSLPNWDLGGASEFGSHGVSNVDGSAALSVDSYEAPPLFGSVGAWSALYFDWGDTNTNLAQSWMDTEGNLSYDLQVKVRAHDLPYYMAGINFRMRNNAAGSDLYTYGISFFRGKMERRDYGGGWGGWSEDSDIPTALIPQALYFSDCPTCNNRRMDLEYDSGHQSGWISYDWEVIYSKPAIVLWQRTSAGFDWLAYKELDAHCSDTQYITQATCTGAGETWFESSHLMSGCPACRLVDWSTILVRLVEGETLTFASGGTNQIIYGDIIRGVSSSAEARVNGTPMLTSGSWASGNGAGTLTLSNLNGSFSSGENIQVAGVNVATAGTLGTTKANYIRAYYGDTSAHGTASDVQTNNQRLANPRDSVHWPPDDATEASASNDYFSLVGGPIQWDGVNSSVASVSIETSTVEPNAIIRTATLCSPTWVDETSIFDPAEGIALVTSGDTSTDIYFDDFAIQLDLKAGEGFLPPIQQ